MKRSYLYAAGLALGVAVWIASGVIGERGTPPAGQKPPADLAATEKVPSVRVRTQSAEPRIARLMVRGQTEAVRKIEVRAEINGRISEIPVAKGARVARGDVLVRLRKEDRPARLAEARAMLEQARVEYEAAQRLSEKGFRAQTQLAARKTALETAKAEVAAAELALARTVIRAPFAGVVGDRIAEIGEYVKSGDPVIRLIDLDPILAVVQVSEREVSRIAPGTVAQVRLVTGQEIAGTVRFIAPEADPATRTFRLEVEIANPDGALADGITAEVTLPLSEVMAHRVSPALLTLNDRGLIGVKTVRSDDTVAFVPVRILDETAEAVWVTGLPHRARLITVGQEFVVDGQKVRPVDETARERADLGGAS
ncbi:MAG: efflux RND transporter periplasmic adaptor subunit [Alphaproteobacteria bacterium]|nr:MAG: efflux RND transporter periplasmic adaptor subunit [Alphaproteobacteria bacterium]